MELATIENLARAYVRLDISPERTVELLRQILLRDQRPQWRNWATRQIKRLQIEDQGPAARLRPPADETPPAPPAPAPVQP